MRKYGGQVDKSPRLLRLILPSHKHFLSLLNFIDPFKWPRPAVGDAVRDAVGGFKQFNSIDAVFSDYQKSLALAKNHKG